jgi:tetratricopeptide (TPR) repeat protein
VLGTLQIQDHQEADAEKSLQRFVELAPNITPEAAQRRSLSQAYLGLAQIAEKRRDFAGAEAWLNRITDGQDLLSAQSRRASLLARQGKILEARALLQALPERGPDDARNKLVAEVQMLRDIKQYWAAHEVLKQAMAKAPGDTDLLYDYAMLSEKIGHLEEMERSLRRLIVAKPDYHHAYNALGYSLADRNMRLDEARELIRKAVALAPADPFIQDSLGWVEFRLGNMTEALRILEAAYKAKPDPEIAAHLGEVLWANDQRDRARAIWKEGLLLNAENETLLGALKRLGVKL